MPFLLGKSAIGWDNLQIGYLSLVSATITVEKYQKTQQICVEVLEVVHIVEP